MGTNRGYLFRAQPPPLEFGRDSKADREVGKLHCGKTESFGHPQITGWWWKLEEGSPRSRAPCAIDLGRMFGFGWLVLSRKWGLKMGKLVAIDPVLPVLGRYALVVRRGFSIQLP